MPLLPVGYMAASCGELNSLEAGSMGTSADWGANLQVDCCHCFHDRPSNLLIAVPCPKAPTVCSIVHAGSGKLGTGRFAADCVNPAGVSVAPRLGRFNVLAAKSTAWKLMPAQTGFRCSLCDHW